MFLLSLPMRGRGLKYIGPADSEKVVLSLPMRGRGLKYAHGNYWCRGIDVAPHAGSAD